MKEIKTGEVYLSKLNLNDIIYEKKHGFVIKSRVVSLPKLDVRTGITSFECLDLNENTLITYHVHPDHPQYNPKLYDYEIK